MGGGLSTVRVIDERDLNTKERERVLRAKAEENAVRYRQLRHENEKLLKHILNNTPGGASDPRVHELEQENERVKREHDRAGSKVTEYSARIRELEQKLEDQVAQSASRICELEREKEQLLNDIFPSAKPDLKGKRAETAETVETSTRIRELAQEIKESERVKREKSRGEPSPSKVAGYSTRISDLEQEVERLKRETKMEPSTSNVAKHNNAALGHTLTRIRDLQQELSPGDA